MLEVMLISPSITCPLYNTKLLWHKRLMEQGKNPLSTNYNGFRLVPFIPLYIMYIIILITELYAGNRGRSIVL